MLQGLKKFIRVALSDRWWFVTFVFLLLFLTSLRVINITADPPPELSISAAPFTDEGLKTYSSRNYHFFGSWKWTPSDGYAAWYKASPLSVRMYRYWFDTFGISFQSMRSINILFSVMTMILLFTLVMRYYNNRYTAFAAMILYGVNHYLMMFNRLAFFENMLVFFTLLIFFSFCELFDRRQKMKLAVTNKDIKSLPQFIYLIIAVFVGCAATVAGIFTKQSIIVVVIAIIPFLTLYMFYSHKMLNQFLIKKFYFTILVIVIGYLLIGHFGWFDKFFKSLLKIKIFDVSIAFLLPLKKHSSNFDPVYLSFVKSLYLEFVYLQPVIFFTGIFFAVKTYYNFLYKSELKIIDTAFATWFLFGFLFLAIMRYHPARYYLLLSIPLVILSARFFTARESFSFSRIVPDRKLSFRRLILSLFWFYLFFYTGVILVNTVLPFPVIKNLYTYAFESIIQKEYTNFIPFVAGALFIQAAVFIGMAYFIKRIRPTFNSKKYSFVIFLCILIFHGVQYVKWQITTDTLLSDFSTALGEVLPENTVLTGCWAPSLSTNNELRAIVIQDRLRYNSKLLKKIIDNKKIPVVNRDGSEGKENGIPLYLFVSTTGPFDMKIRATFGEYISPEKRIFVLPMGLYDVEMYKLSKRVDVEEIRALREILQKKMNDE